MNKNKNSDKEYRRGIVLGLTFAELLMLLLFVILLVLGVTLKRNGATLNNPNANSTNASDSDASNSDQAISDKALSDLLKEKDESALAKAKALINEGEKDKAYQALLGKNIDSDQINGISTQQELVQLNNVVAYIKSNDPQSFAKVQQYIITGNTEEAYRTLIESSVAYQAIIKETKMQQSMISDCKAQNKHLVNINNVGRGGDFPSCWFDENGAKQFIYDIDLTDTGIVIHDNDIPSRVAEKARLPLKGFVYEKAMQPNDFVKAGLKLKQHSDENNCRFFVKIKDKTSAQKKEHYKKLKASVENIFYKKDV